MRKEENSIIEKIEESIRLNMKNVSEVGGKFHHNSSYNRIISILEHGILPLRKLNSLEISEIDKKMLETYDDTTSHVNGIDGISLSIVGLKDLNVNEEEYNPFYEENVDFIIDDVKAMRITQNYGNEYVTFNNVNLENIKALDIRILKLIEKKRKSGSLNDEFIDSIIQKYNMIIEVCRKIKNEKIDIEVREMSEGSFILDVDLFADFPILTKK